MTTRSAPARVGEPGQLPHHEFERARAYGQEALSLRTRQTYAEAWADFSDWCGVRELRTLPADPETLAGYLADAADRGRAIATIRKRAGAISRAHQLAGFSESQNPARDARVRAALSGIARSNGTAQKKKDALTLERLRAALLALGSDEGARHALRVLRDRAVMLLGFAGAFRRAELAALDVADLRWEQEGIVVTLRRSKTDQEGAGREVAVPRLAVESLCPVRALRAWLDAAAIVSGPLFRTFSLPRGRRGAIALQENRIDGRDVGRIVQHATLAAGIEGDFSAHSLRAGFITAAAEKKIPEVDIARVTGHRSVAVLRGYVRRATVFDDPPLRAIIGS
ncbi:MAG: site-specific integrase [Vulcanimicrobiaceae bacterium]